VRTLLRDNGLSLFFGTIFLATLIGQAFAGQRVYNHEAVAHGGEAVSLGRYVVSSHYGQAVLENWQSEWLQFLLFILATMWLIQKGSPESEPEPGMSTDKEEKIGRYAEANSPRFAKYGDWRTTLYSYSLLIVFAMIFLGSWLGQSFTGLTEHNAEQREHGEPTKAWAEYVTSAEFWEDTLQNWQSEFIAVGAIMVFGIFLRARHSAESKRVGDPHDKTGN
jgi:hypothetical protein